MRYAALLICAACFCCSTSLPRKAYESRWAEVQSEIEKGADPNGLLDTSGDSILFFAARDGNMDMVRFLLARGANPDIRSPSGETPLYAAVEQCRPEVAKLLVKHGANPRKPANFRGSVMHMAAANCTELIGFLASLEISVDDENAESNVLTPLMAAASADNVDSARELLRLGADIHRRNRDGQNAFDFIFHLKDSPMLILLLDHGAIPAQNDVSFVLSFWGVASFENLQALLRRRLITPAQALHAVVYAAPHLRGAAEGEAIQSREMIIERLVRTGIPITSLDPEGRTVLMTALRSDSSIEFLKFLRKQGANPAGEDKKGQSALSLAVNSYEESMLSTGEEQAQQILNFIADESAKQGAQLSRSERILLALVQQDKMSLKSALNGGYRFINQESAQIALVYAAAHHDPNVLMLLLDAGARPNRAEPEPGLLCCLRPTVLIAAAKHGRVGNVRLLLARGANPQERFGCCGGGIGPLDVAKDVEIRRILEAAGE
jgi:ankyrin repeat protein